MTLKERIEDVKVRIKELKAQKERIEIELYRLNTKPEKFGHEMELKYFPNRNQYVLVCKKCNCWEGSYDSRQPCRGK